ncbi:MAG: hypothetical protein IKO61_04945 [Lachnospiraceae bacterium]|nr:hypothetical protein [Lachnospiraceae bacterium]
MNNTFLIALIIYLLVFLVISIADIKKISVFTDYAVAGRHQGSFAVIMTMLATIIGASTTIGITDTVYSIGFPGIWWLAFGAIGLMLQSFLISEKVRGLNVSTLPELAKVTVGKPAEVLLAAVIVISWIGVIAGQLVAMNSLITFATGKSSRGVFLIVSAIVILYTIIGGQLSVVRTDRIQLFIILAGVLVCFFYLYFVKGGDIYAICNGVEVVNENYGPVNMFTQFFVIGGVYFLGPDIMSRNFISKDAKTAKDSAIISGLILLLFAILITMVGMWLRVNVPQEVMGDNKALMYAVSIIPKVPAILLVFGLLSAILSSTDTCMINAATIFVKDILGKESVAAVRITVAVLGVLSSLLCITGSSDIMTLLSNAYSIYTPGVIFPLLVAIIAHGRRKLNLPLWLVAVAAGGSLGLANAYLSKPLISLGVPEELISYFPLIGMGVSLVIALVSVRWNAKAENKAK